MSLGGLRRDIRASLQPLVTGAAEKNDQRRDRARWRCMDATPSPQCKANPNPLKTPRSATPRPRPATPAAPTAPKGRRIGRPAR